MSESYYNRWHESDAFFFGTIVWRIPRLSLELTPETALNRTTAARQFHSFEPIYSGTTKDKYLSFKTNIPRSSSAYPRSNYIFNAFTSFLIEVTSVTMVLSIFGHVQGSPQWQPDPDGRGTSSLLQQCIITIGLCAYSAINLNIPAHRSNAADKFFSKIGWVLLALLAPEVVVYIAWSQRRAAQAIAASLNKASGRVPRPSWTRRLLQKFLRRRSQSSPNARPGDDAPSSSEKIEEHSPEDSLSCSNEPFTIVHGFFVLTGGISFDQSKDPIKVWPYGLERMVLRPSLAVWCFENGYEEIIPDVSVQEIKDKSKADGVAKGLICIQALWFCLQFVTRIAQKLPVSLLELNTVAHALCALLIYTFWWHKPSDIGEPLLIPTQQSEKIRSLCAKASFDSKLGGYCSAEPSWFEKHPRNSVAHANRGGLDDRSNELFFRLLNLVSPSRRHRKRLVAPWTQGFGSWSRDKDIFAIKGQDPRIGRRRQTIVGLRLDPSLRHSTSYYNAEPKDELRAESFDGIDGSLESYTFVSSKPPIILLGCKDQVPGSDYWLKFEGSCEMDERLLARLQWASKLKIELPWSRYGVLSHYISNIDLKVVNEVNPREEIQPSMDWKTLTKVSLILPEATSLMLSSILYGGLHALAFGIPFHSTVEALLWKLSCLAVLGAPVAVVVLYPVVFACYDTGERVFEWVGRELDNKSRSWAFRLPFYIVVGILGTLFLSVYFLAPLYTLSRLFLVVEVFLNVPYVDPGVYQTPNWSVYWPHIT